MAWDPAVDKYLRSAEAAIKKQQIKKHFQFWAERVGRVSPPPKSQAGLLKLLTAKYGEAEAKHLMRKAKIRIPKPRKNSHGKPRNTPGDQKDWNKREWLKFNKMEEERHEHMGKHQPTEQPAAPATDDSLDFPPIPTPTPKDDEVDIDADAIFKPRPVVSRGNQSQKAKRARKTPPSK